MKVANVEQMQRMDRRAVEEYGIPEQVLMENAGLAVYWAIQKSIGVAGRRFAVVCGLGNNGGDGLVVARAIRSHGGRTSTFLLGDPTRYSGAARTNFEMLSSSGAEIVVEPTAEELAAGLQGCDGVIDAIFGTGITRDVGGRYREAVEAVNSASAPVVAIDIPSGVDGNTGEVRGVAVRAAITVTFGLPKLGNLLYPGAGRCGRLFLSHISFPPQLTDSSEILVEINAPASLPARRPDGHKGSFGDVLCIAGAASYYGAPSLSALSVLRAGGGYSRLAAPRSVIPVIAGLASEVVFHPQQETASGSLASTCREALLELAEQVDFVVLGPGLSLADEAQELVRSLVPAIGQPLLVDGDGLTAISSHPELVRRRTAPTVLTPHPGEMARLTGLSVADIRADPVGVLQRTAADLGAVVLLKGAHTLIGLEDGRVFVNPSGNSGMGSAGSGDVLTGTIAAMAGLGLDVPDAACAGTFLHGLAGDLAAASKGEDGITARDVLDHLPFALRRFRAEHPVVCRHFYGTLEVL